MLCNKIVCFGSTFVVASALIGCAPAMVKDIAANKTGYMNDYFNPQHLSEGISRELSKSEKVSYNYNSISVKLNVTFEDLDKKRETPTAVFTFKNAGNGFVQEMREFSNNGIPYGIKYVLSYGGLIGLKEQNVRFNQTNASFVTEAKQFTIFQQSFLKPTENTDYSYEWTYGNSPQIANFNTMKLSCKTEAFFSASKISSKLNGRAIEFKCERFVNGIQRSREKYTFLESYGLAVTAEHQSSGQTEKYDIQGVEVL